MTLQRNKLFKSIVTFKIKYQFGSKPTFLGHDAGSFGGENWGVMFTLELKLCFYWASKTLSSSFSFQKLTVELYLNDKTCYCISVQRKRRVISSLS